MTDRGEVERLRAELTTACRNNHARNLELDALHYVWCDGGCRGGVHRWPCEGRQPISEELVQAAERQTRRLRSWWQNHQYREQYRIDPSKLPPMREPEPSRISNHVRPRWLGRLMRFLLDL